jgi:EAL domain-containing protein (putative c-di-GMP-specific phosphodiesterase class I)
VRNSAADAPISASLNAIDDEGLGLSALLRFARAHLGMDLAWISQVQDGNQSILSADGDIAALAMISGEMGLKVPRPSRSPDRILDAGLGSGLASVSIVDVPLRGSGGQTIGTLCCLNRAGSTDSPDGVHRFLELVAELAVTYLQSPAAIAERRRVDEAARIHAVLENAALRIVFQPVVRLDDAIPVAYEALARFDDPHFPTPAHAFLAAARAGIGVELELLAVRSAFGYLRALPPDMWLGVNLSAEALLVAEVQDELLEHASSRIGVEVTEHTEVRDYTELTAVTERLRAAGIQIGVDDAGAGYASFRHILKLRPTVIKLDLELVRDIDTDIARQALTRSFVGFAAESGCVLVAEGIETEAELRTLEGIGVGYGQGYLFAYPAALPAQATALFRSTDI